jgi:hypothetical protein
MKTVYTAIFSNYDDIKEPFFVSQHWKYVCFTDQDLKSDVWEIRKVPVMDCGPAKTARYYKINFHKHIETEFSLWVDATFFINIDLNRWWKRFKAPFTCIDHPFDSCIYTEIRSCMNAGKGDFWKLVKQAAEYRDIVPENNGLIASGLLMRQKTPAVKKFCEDWWAEVEKYTERDQIAFGMAAIKNPGVYDTIEWDYTVRDEFIHCPHIHKSWREQRKKEIIRKYGSPQE